MHIEQLEWPIRPCQSPPQCEGFPVYPVRHLLAADSDLPLLRLWIRAAIWVCFSNWVRSSLIWSSLHNRSASCCLQTSSKEDTYRGEKQWIHVSIAFTGILKIQLTAWFLSLPVPSLWYALLTLTFKHCTERLFKFYVSCQSPFFILGN